MTDFSSFELDVGELRGEPQGTATLVSQDPERQEPEAEPMSFGEAFNYAYEYETVSGWLFNQYKMSGLEPDEDWQQGLTLGFIEENAQDLPPEFYGFLAESESQADFDNRLTLAREKRQDSLSYANSGMVTQLGSQLAASALDLPVQAATVVTGAVLGNVAGGTAAVAANLTRLGITGKRIQKIVTGATLAAAEGIAIEALLSVDDPMAADRNLLIAGLTAASFGAAGATWASRGTKEAYRKTLKDQQYKALEDIKFPLDDTDKKYFSDVSKGQVQKKWENITSNVDEAVGRGDFISMVGQLKNSGDEGFAELAESLGEDGVRGGKPSLALKADMYFRSTAGEYSNKHNKVFFEWAKENNMNVVGTFFRAGRKEFNNSVGRYIRGGLPNVPENSAIAKAGKAALETLQNTFKYAREAGVRGFENIDISKVADYLPRRYRATELRKLTRQHGEKKVIDFMARAYKSANPDVEDAIARAVSRATYKRFVTIKTDAQNFSTLFSNNTKEELANLLRGSKVSEKEIARIVEKVAERDTQGSLGVTRRRLNFDEAFVDPDLNLSFTDLLDNDVEGLTVHYVKQVGGAAELAKMGYKDPNEVFADIERKVNEASIKGMDADKARAYGRKLENIAKQSLGIPVKDFTKLDAFFQATNGYNYVARGGSFALSSLPELYINVAENGLKAALGGMKSYRQMVKAFKNGEPQPDVLRFVESLGIGREVDIMNMFVIHQDEDALGKLATPIKTGITSLKRAGASLSMLPHLTNMSQMWAGVSTVNRFVNEAYSGNASKVTKWMKQLGFENPEEINKMYEGLKTYTVTEDSWLTGKKVQSFDYDEWMKADPESADKFRFAVARANNHIIQKNLAGELPEFMSQPIWQAIFQFRTFALASYAKKTLNALQRRDVNSVHAIVGTSFIGGITYAAQVYTMSLGQKDPQAFRDERLGEGKFVKSMVQRGSYASLIPDIIDTGVEGVDFFYDPSEQNVEKIFNPYSRNSGSPTGLIEGSSPYQIGKSLSNSAKILNPTRTSPITQQEARSASYLLPFRKILPVDFLLESYISELPKSKKQSKKREWE